VQGGDWKRSGLAGPFYRGLLERNKSEIHDGRDLAGGDAGDRELRQYDTIIIDEAHERSLNIDFLVGLSEATG
jgi:hypothetical protein